MTPDQRSKSFENSSLLESASPDRVAADSDSASMDSVHASIASQKTQSLGSTGGGKSIFSGRRLGLFGSIALFGVTLYFLFSLWGGASKTTGKQLTYTVAKGDLIVTVLEQGTVESSNNHEVKCKVRGYSVVTWVIPSGTQVEPGDELVRLDTKRIEDAIGKGTTDAYVAKATYERTKANVARAEIAIDAYLEGTYRSQLKALEKQLELAEANLKSTTQTLQNSSVLFNHGSINEFEFQSNEFAVSNASLELKIQQTAINVLNKYTKEMELQTLNGNLSSLQSKLKADEAGLAMDEGRRDRAIEEMEYCKIVASRPGLVIYPSAAAWKGTPDVTEGGSVRHDQVLLLMPDLTQMQVKVGVHESVIDQVNKGMVARVSLPDFDLTGEVASIASVAKPAGWWTGNMVKYDTVIGLPGREGLKPGMSAEVEIVLKEHHDVLLLPVAAVVETERQKLCWVETTEGVNRRVIELGDSNDVFVQVKAGLAEGDRVILNPLKYIEDAKGEALRAFDEYESISKPSSENAASPEVKSNGSA